MVWIDVTEIRNWRGHYTGIQRVISKLGEQLKVIPGSYRTCYFDPATNVFRVCEFDFSQEVTYGDNARESNASYSDPFVTYIKSKISPQTKNRLKKIRKLTAVTNISDQTVDFEAKDVLFIPGAFWIYSFNYLEGIKARTGVRVVGVMYDLVPVVVPQFTAKVTIDSFGDNFKKALGLFDYWFAISKNTKADMLATARLQGVKLDASSVDIITLGTEAFDAKLALHKPATLQLKPEEFALFVSTIEARKNQNLVYQAVKYMQESGKAHLPVVLVGKHGWLSDDFIYVLQNDPTITSHIIWLERVDDAGLRWLYKNCAYTLYPSYYEGWGLPVAEALTYQKLCIASSGSSIPEVAGELIEYFSPYSPVALSKLMQKYSQAAYRAQRQTIIQKYVPPTWEQCAKQVHTRIRQLSR